MDTKQVLKEIERQLKLKVIDKLAENGEDRELFRKILKITIQDVKGGEEYVKIDQTGLSAEMLQKVETALREVLSNWIR